MTDAVRVEGAVESTMAWVELECSAQTCTLGPRGTRWKPPDLPPGTVVQFRSNHIHYNHGALFRNITKLHSIMITVS